MKLEVVQVPVSDVSRARDFYSERIGFNVDIDRVVPGGMRIVQLTPPGSGCSIQLVEGDEPQRGLTLVVSDIVAVHAELTGRGAPLSEVVHFEDGKQVPGHSDEPWSTMAFFSDPDGNRWIMQERPGAES
ncbi:VOC family protein [Actinomadura fibrosa]|uniref:VOC family protein n=1 Tax=Actinomadura fibrosa TaxID=111802 RepID=A0ABW2XTH9_9ACTN|nr:VOC family protein [Actinomadura fibrosa]